MNEWNLKQLEQEIASLMDIRREMFRWAFNIEERIAILKKRIDKLKEKK